MPQKTALIVGAGPAGLTAALELVRGTDIQPIVVEMTDSIGGISRTVNYRGNRIDIGGHRFFSKSDRVMDWWLDILHIEGADEPCQSIQITYQRQKRNIPTKPKRSARGNPDMVFLIRNRMSRILFNGMFFDYPLKLSIQTISKLGFIKTLRAGLSYLRIKLFPIKKESTLEEFVINRFGRELYQTFFKSYTEKVWGVPCNEISAEWGAQRIKGLSISKAVGHALKSLLPNKDDLSQKSTETSLIERFIYPKFGPGQLWEEVAKQVQEQGGEILTSWRADQISLSAGSVSEVTLTDSTGQRQTFAVDYLISTMPVTQLIRSLGNKVPTDVQNIANGLLYRDFITVGVLLNKLDLPDGKTSLPDNWIYVQQGNVKVGRIQIFNNWSPYMVSDPETSWLGLEYFCSEGDELWGLSDSDLERLAIRELSQLNIANSEDVIDSTVIRQAKAYPAYFGSYDKFNIIQSYTDSIPNLFLIGRNGMHRYNNQDHSMLTAMEAVKMIINGDTDKTHLWNINAEAEYHEQQ